MGTCDQSFADIVQRRLEELGKRAFNVEQERGLPRDAIRNVLRSQKQDGPTLTRARQIAEALGLEFYIGPPRETGPVHTVELDHEDFAAIPRVDARLAAGAGAENHEVSLEGALAFRHDWLRERDISPAQACLLRVSGDSMAPTLYDGDLVMIDERRTTIRNRHVYALIDTDGAARVKRLDHVPDQLIILTSDNPAHPTETRSGPDMNRLRILGEIVWSAHAW